MRAVTVYLLWGIARSKRVPKAQFLRDDGSPGVIYSGDPIEEGGDATGWIVAMARGFVMLHDMPTDRLEGAVEMGRQFYEAHGCTFSPERAKELLTEPAQLVPLMPMGSA